MLSRGSERTQNQWDQRIRIISQYLAGQHHIHRNSAAPARDDKPEHVFWVTGPLNDFAALGKSFEPGQSATWNPTDRRDVFHFFGIGFEMRQPGRRLLTGASG